MKDYLKCSERNYGLDILKIISIISVILLHYNNGTMGGTLKYVEKESINFYITYFFESCTIIACNLFVMISGYYLCNSSKIKIRKVFDIIGLLVFYGVIIYIVSLLKGLTIFDKESFKTMLRTITARWFIDTYILLYILHPFINKVIYNITKKEFEWLIIICVFFFSIWSSILKPSNVINVNQFIKDSGYGIINFIMIYFIGAYIRIHRNSLNPNKLLMFMTYMLLSIWNSILMTKYAQAFQYNFIINIINTILVFLIFKNLNIKREKWISKISTTSLAVYIIHENSFIVSYIFKEIFRIEMFYNSNMFLLHMIVTCLTIFIICVVIEFIRKYLFKYTVDKLIDRIKWINKEIIIS